MSDGRARNGPRLGCNPAAAGPPLRLASLARNQLHGRARGGPGRRCCLAQRRRVQKCRGAVARRAQQTAPGPQPGCGRGTATLAPPPGRLKTPNNLLKLNG
eukprot:9077408-Lingulodinium_polyedra.AAC.1